MKGRGGGKSLVNLFLTFCKSHRGFTRQQVSPNVYNWHRRFKHHQNSTRRPPERDKKSETGRGEGVKKGRNFGRSSGVGSRGGDPKAGVPKGGARTVGPERWGHEGWGAQHLFYFLLSPCTAVPMLTQPPRHRAEIHPLRIVSGRILSQRHRSEPDAKTFPAKLPFQ